MGWTTFPLEKYTTRRPIGHGASPHYALNVHHGHSEVPCDAPDLDGAAATNCGSYYCCLSILERTDRIIRVIPYQLSFGQKPYPERTSSW